MVSLFCAWFFAGALVMDLVYALCYAIKNEIKMSHIIIVAMVLVLATAMMLMSFWAWFTLTLETLSITIKPDALWEMGMSLLFP
jgi:hypothetical protein